MQTTIKYGYGVALRTFPGPVTVAQLKGDPSLRMELGYGDNVRVLINGVEMPSDVQVSQGATVTIETAANTKA